MDPDRLNLDDFEAWLDDKNPEAMAALAMRGPMGLTKWLKEYRAALAELAREYASDDDTDEDDDGFGGIFGGNDD